MQHPFGIGLKGVYIHLDAGDGERRLGLVLFSLQTLISTKSTAVTGSNVAAAWTDTRVPEAGSGLSRSSALQALIPFATADQKAAFSLLNTSAPTEKTPKPPATHFSGNFGTKARKLPDIQAHQMP